MAYVPDSEVTIEYINFLIARNGFTNVTDQYPDYGEAVVIRDLNGQDSFYNGLPQARDSMITQYVIQQNS